MYSCSNKHAQTHAPARVATTSCTSLDARHGAVPRRIASDNRELTCGNYLSALRAACREYSTYDVALSSRLCGQSQAQDAREL